MSELKITEAVSQKDNPGKPNILRRHQEPRRPVLDVIELATVSETRATIANVRMTTTTKDSLLGRQLEGQGSCQIEVLYFHLDT